MLSKLNIPFCSAVLTNGNGFSFRFCLFICDKRNDKYKTTGEQCKNYPQKPAAAASVFCFCFSNRHNNAVSAAAFRTFHFVTSV